MAKCVNHYNNTHRLKDYPLSPDMIAKEVKPIPVKLWEYGTQYLSGLLSSVDDVKKLQLALLPEGKASVHKGQGIYYKGLMYTCETGIQEGWFERFKGTPTRSFAIAYEPIVDRIYLSLDRGRRFEECVLTAPYRRFQGKDWYEVQDYFKVKNIEDKKSVTETQQSDAELHADINNLIAQEIEATERALASENISKGARLRGTRASREQLKQFERKHGPVSPGNLSTVSTPSEAAVSEGSNKHLFKLPHRMHMFRRLSRLMKFSLREKGQGRKMSDNYSRSL